MKHTLHLLSITAAGAGLLFACGGDVAPAAPTGAPPCGVGEPGSPAPASTPTTPGEPPTASIPPGGDGVSTGQSGALGFDPRPKGIFTGPPSCADGPLCQGVDCCDSPVVPGGAFAMGRGLTGPDALAAGYANEVPEHPASLSSFRLDTFEVTVGRFRQFVRAYTGPPEAGAGAHPKWKASGWSDKWNVEMPKDGTQFLEFAGDFDCGTDFKSWTKEVGPNENLPMTCVTWYDAFAFCAWDGGRLPTEAEWEYAAAGGSENRMFPWDGVSLTREHASYECLSDGDPACDVADMPPVGSKPAGNGRWGQRDMAGGAFEWTMDWFDEAWYVGEGRDCKDCINLKRPDSDLKVFRGGDFKDSAELLRAAVRLYSPPTFRADNVGFRCARPVRR